MKTVCFLTSTWSPQYLLSYYSKMTPGRSGVWKDLKGITDVEKADVVVVIDDTTTKIPHDRIIYLGAHPTTCEGYKCFDNKPAIAKFDCRDTFGFGEWWLSHDYDTLSTMEPPTKSKDLICILSDQRVYDYHRKRIEFMVEYCKKFPVDLYGRIKPQVGEESLSSCFKGVLGPDNGAEDFLDNYRTGKEHQLLHYRYSLEFDMGSSPDWGDCEYYFSERFFDAMLMWAMPIYYGGTKIHKFLPQGSFMYVDVFKDTPAYIQYAIASDLREDNLENMREARNLLLNKYQIWPRVWGAMNGNT